MPEDGREAVCLSTCNRTELYVAAADVEAAERAAVAALAELEPEVEPALYRLRDQAAALHLFRVAAGLDSLVPGRGRDPRPGACGARRGRRPGPLLDRVFRQALHAGRKVRAQTAIGESACVGLAPRPLRSPSRCSAISPGARSCSSAQGRSASRPRAASSAAARRSRSSPTAPSITPPISPSVSAREPLPLERLEEQLAAADVVVSSTSAPGYVLEAPTVERALRARRGRQLLLIDLAVPRDLDPAIHDLDGCYLYDIDDLQAIVNETLVGRRGETERAEAIVASEAEKFHEWQASLEIVPAIASLRARAEEIREAELRKAEGLLGRLDESQRSAVEAITAQIVNKLLHLPTVRMKQAAAAADGVIYADAVRHLFGLGEDER